ERLHRRALDDLAGIHHQHLVRELGDDAEVVSDEHDRGAARCAELAEKIENLRLDRDVEGRRRLVGDDELRIAGERHGNHRALARRSRSSAGGSFRRSTPSNSTSPLTIRPGGLGTRPMIESAVTLFPLPLSPTTPSVRPAASVQLTPSTATTSPASVRNAVRRSRSSRSGAFTRSALPAAGVSPRR